MIDPTPRMVLDEWVDRTIWHQNWIAEQHLRVLLKPAPRFVPKKLWLKLAAKFIVLETKTVEGKAMCA